MRAHFDEVVTAGRKRQRAFEMILGELLRAEITEKQARSIRYQLGIAKLPLAKELTEFAFADSPVNQALVEELATGAFLAQQRNVVLIGGTGTGKTHLAIGIARTCVRQGTKSRFFNVVDLVNQLEAESKAGRPGRLADQLTRVDLVVLDELGYLPFAQSGGQLLFHLISRLYDWDFHFRRPRMDPLHTRKPQRPRESFSSHNRPGSEAVTQPALTSWG